MPQPANAKSDAITLHAGPRLRIAMIVAIAADVLQFAVFPFVLEGGASPPDDVIDLCVGGLLTFLLGWHWEFLPSFAAKLIPGVEFVPLWTLAVANVYRKARAHAAASAGAVNQRTADRNAPIP